MVRILAAALSSLAVLITVTLLVMTNNYLTQDPAKFRIKALAPDFASFTNSKDKKQAFFAYLSPMVQVSNQTVLQQRERLEAIAISLQEGVLKKPDAEFLNSLAREYGLESVSLSAKEGAFRSEQEALSSEQALSLKTVEQLILRVDAVPESLALAQAAKESGWGTSRFARDANNYFGQWCYSEGCGLIPNSRPQGATHEVRKFDQAYDSVEAYLKNLNTHDAYENLRALRTELRLQGEVSGLKLSAGLGSYSQRGKAYVKEIQSMIRFNQLDQLDQPEN